MSKSRLLILHCFLFGLGVFAFTFYWRENFVKHITYKGDEFFIMLKWLLLFGYIFCFTVQFTVRRIRFLLVVVIPLLTAVIAFLIGLLLMGVTQIGWIPRHYITGYGLLYGAVAILTVLGFWRLIPARPFTARGRNLH